MVIATSLVLATGGLAGCAQSSSAAPSATTTGDTALTVFISGDTNVQALWDKALIPAFEKTNPRISVTTTIDLHGEHDAQTQANLAAATKQDKTVPYDLIDAGFVPTVGKTGLLLPADESSIPNLKSVPEATRAQGGSGGIPYRASSVLLAYDSTKVTAPPRTLDALLDWIRANPGEFAYNSPSTGGSGGSFVTTVLSKYLSAAQQQTMATSYDKSLESSWDQGFQTLHDLGQYMYQKGVYPNGNAQVLQLLESGQISMAPVWSDQFITAQNSGAMPKTVKYLQISNPSFTGSASFLGIPKTESDAKKDAVYKLADFVLSTQGQEIVADAVSGYPVVPLNTLPQSVADKFSAANPSALRLSFSSQFTSDMNAEWSAKVPK
ncbi:extracellular solute-binding protein [Propionibacterium cyclohexanicum]|uniref:extracellular solute-binding protein n=1 Tax=Propionibacterium cyclohexanicum TaxID=64702 RepID=UPI001C4366CF|nr:extracellular solute-binding protein [Propionibacterium cyclohexanicum]